MLITLNNIQFRHYLLALSKKLTQNGTVRIAQGLRVTSSLNEYNLFCTRCALCQKFGDKPDNSFVQPGAQKVCCEMSSLYSLVEILFLLLITIIMQHLCNVERKQPGTCVHLY